MAVSYDPTLPAELDRMRFLLGDVDTASALEQDETYLANLALWGEQLGTAMMAEALASRFAMRPTSVSSQGDSISWNERVKTWLALAKRIRDELASTGAEAVVQTVRGTKAQAETCEYCRPDDWSLFTGGA